MSPADLYHYKAYVTRVPSGQMCLMDIDLGMGVWTRGEEVLLHRVKSPEDRDLAAEARDYLRTLILDREVLLHTIKDRRTQPARLSAEMIVVTERGATVDVIEALVKKGYATRSTPSAG